MFWRYLGTCSGQNWFTCVLVVPRYVLRLKKIYLSLFAFVGVFTIYLCLGGTWYLL